MEQKLCPIFTKTIEDRTVTGFAAVMGNIDSGGDRITNGAFKKTLLENASRVKHLWMHEGWRAPIAVIKELREVDTSDIPAQTLANYPDVTGALLVKREYLDTDRGNEILAGIKAGAIDNMSIGYDPVKFDFETLEVIAGKVQVRNLRELRLWDTSDVNWGMNDATLAVKAVIPYKDEGTAEEGTSWSKPNLENFTGEMWEELSASERRRISAHYAWSDNSPAEKFEDLKLPHHKASKDGVGPAIWKGIVAAMGALMGARGGVDVPEEGRKSIYNHLAKHYAQYDQTPPDFKMVQLSYHIVKALEVEGLSDDLLTGIKALNGMLLAAEPEIVPLTAEMLKRKIELYARDPILLRSVR